MQLVSEAWYCARTKPKHEQLVAANLSRNHGLRVFHPRLRLERSTQRGVVRVVESLFPCYIFIRCNVEEKADEIRYVSGMSSLVRFGDKIATVPDSVIEELTECFRNDEPLVVEDALNSGTEVTVAGGAFMGMNGVVLRVLPAKQRVQVLLDFLGRSTVAEVDRVSLKTERRIADLVPTLAAAGLISVAASLSQHK
ncbi:MAG: NusG antitermination factor [Verrucomicrobiales bacterium]|nr:NusG antitermination factor [Verrucomicrobiales bacterium]